MQPLYPILDVDLAAAHGHDLVACARQFTALGLQRQQLRAKSLSDRDFLRLAERLAPVVPELMIDSRADIALLSGATGVHLGPHDLPLTAVRGLQRGFTLGVSTHSLAEARAALADGPHYFSFGPVFPTRSKAHPAPVVGLALLAQARALSAVPLVACGGIQENTCVAVWQAGADAVAVISALWAAPDPAAAAHRFLLAFAALSCHSPEESPEERPPSDPQPHGH